MRPLCREAVSDFVCQIGLRTATTASVLMLSIGSGLPISSRHGAPSSRHVTVPPRRLRATRGARRGACHRAPLAARPEWCEISHEESLAEAEATYGSGMVVESPDEDAGRQEVAS